MTICHVLRSVLAGAIVGLYAPALPALAAPALGGGIHLWSPGFCGGRASTDREVDYFYAQGMRLFRIGLPWEMTRRSLFGPLNDAYMTIIDADVAHILSKPGTTVLLEVHNSMHYSVEGIYHDGSGIYGGLPCFQGTVHTRVGDPGVPLGVTADLWNRLATRYPDKRIIYGLMNEPADVSEQIIFDELKASIAAIRALGRTNVIAATVEPNGDLCNYGGHCNGYANIQGLLAQDPLHNTIADVHVYFDKDGSGQSAQCVAGVGAVRAKAVLAWANRYDVDFVTGEFAGAANEECRKQVTDYLTQTLASGHERGWTWYVGGVNDSYFFQLLPSALNANINATGPVEAKPQMEWLRSFLH